MIPWLATIEVAVILAALVGTVLLRRHADRAWAEHLARQRVMASPPYQKLAKDLIQFKITLRDALTPAMVEAAKALSQFATAVDALPRPTWRQRVALRIRGWFA